ncbi:MAG TPA: DUF4231 domain-containing protein [Smithellaceae bacterium]|nr:DUF4231 domain-containing protein [Smithellaceae bacterium]
MNICKSIKENMINPPDWVAKQPAWLRLEDQLTWYDQKSVSAQRWYKSLKFIQVLLAISIPIFCQFEGNVGKWLASIAGSLIALIEAVQHMNQYSTLWITYRSTAERLKHEKFLFLSVAGPYVELSEKEQLTTLAQRVEEHVSTEHANWFNETRRVTSEIKKDKT